MFTNTEIKNALNSYMTIKEDLFNIIVGEAHFNGVYDYVRGRHVLKYKFTDVDDINEISSEERFKLFKQLRMIKDTIIDLLEEDISKWQRLNGVGRINNQFGMYLHGNMLIVRFRY